MSGETTAGLSVAPAPGTQGVWDWDIPADRLRVDTAFAALYGLDPQAGAAGLPTRTFFAAIHPEDRSRIKIAVAGMLAGTEIFSKEFRVVAPSGDVLWLHANGRAEHNASYEPVRFTGFLVDVTERRRTEERLRVAQSAGGVGTFEYSDGYATVTVSDAFCNLLGFHPAAALPVQTINGIVAGPVKLIPEGSAAFADLVIDAEFVIRRSDDGEERWIARRGELLKEGDGYRLIGVIYDVTRAKSLEATLRELNDTLESRVEREVAIRHEAEIALRQAQKMEALGQLTGGIAHDFNNLLMAISSSLALLRKRVPGDVQAAKLIDSAMQGAERGATLTQRMLAFARRQDLAMEAVAVGDLLAGMTELVRRTLGPNWSLALDVASGLPPILADANQLELAVLNLAVNARDAMPRGGEIRIGATLIELPSGNPFGVDSGDYVRLSVVDAGEGMDAETMARATEPFFTTKGVGKGTGLGLSMIHGFARQLGGTFSLESEPGRGTTASLFLPVGENEPYAIGSASVSTDDVVATDAPTEALRILAVDDDALILMNTAALLEDLGHEVLEASSGSEALAILRDDPAIQLLITDQAMPQMTGLELLSRVEREWPDLPVVVATGYSELPSEAGSRIVKLGKPFDQPQLSHAIRTAMQRTWRKRV